MSIRLHWIVETEAPAQPDPAEDILSALFPESADAAGAVSADPEVPAAPALESHDVLYTFERLTGRITVSIDGERFTLSAGPLGVGAARREIFRLGDEQAILAVDRQGRAELILAGEVVPPLPEAASRNERHSLIEIEIK